MASGSYRFANFSLDPADRQLRRDDAPVELNARYFDALALLVSEPGKLISKERFLAEVWRGLVVSDEALTQCIKTIRRQLGDSASSPRFIETVPKHGYRFIAPIAWIDGGVVATASPELVAAPLLPAWRDILQCAGAGALGGGSAGIAGGLFYGLAGVAEAPQAGMGMLSVLLVFLCLSVLMGSAGGAGIGIGVAAAGVGVRRGEHWVIAGCAAGGMVIGALVKMLGLDAFNLLLGQSPGDITGAFEGALLGGAVGLGLWMGRRGMADAALRRGTLTAAAAGGLAGALLPFSGGRLMGGSLDLLARSFPDSRFRLDDIGSLFGENTFGLVSQSATGCLEGAVFCGCVAAALLTSWHGTTTLNQHRTPTP